MLLTVLSLCLRLHSNSVTMETSLPFISAGGVILLTDLAGDTRGTVNQRIYKPEVSVGVEIISGEVL